MSYNLIDFGDGREIRVCKHQISVFMNNIGKNGSAMDLKHGYTFREVNTAMGGYLVVVTDKVPWAYFTMRGISPHRDVDYTSLNIENQLQGSLVTSLQHMT